MSKAAWRSILLTATLAALAFGLAPPALAQSQATTGLIEGTVLDQSDAPVPGATVTLHNNATNFERTVDGFLAGLPYDKLLPALAEINVNPLERPVVDLGF